MVVDTKNLVSITEANQNFSRVARMVDEKRRGRHPEEQRPALRAGGVQPDGKRADGGGRGRAGRIPASYRQKPPCLRGAGEVRNPVEKAGPRPAFRPDTGVRRNGGDSGRRAVGIGLGRPVPDLRRGTGLSVPAGEGRPARFRSCEQPSLCGWEQTDRRSCHAGLSGLERRGTALWSKQELIAVFLSVASDGSDWRDLQQWILGHE